MKEILYIHGLGGGRDGRFATVLRKNLGDDYKIIAPEIPVQPREAMAFVQSALFNHDYDLVVASSLGAYYLMYCMHLPKKLLINPAVKAGEYIEKYVGKGVHEYNTPRLFGPKEYVIDDKFISDLKEMEFDLDDEELLVTRCMVSPEDELFGEQNVDMCIKKFLDENATIIHSSHRVEEDVIINDIIPKIKEFIEEDFSLSPIVIGPWVDFDDDE